MRMRVISIQRHTLLHPSMTGALSNLVKQERTENRPQERSKCTALLYSTTHRYALLIRAMFDNIPTVIVQCKDHRNELLCGARPS